MTFWIPVIQATRTLGLSVPSFADGTSLFNPVDYERPRCRQCHLGRPVVAGDDSTHDLWSEQWRHRRTGSAWYTNHFGTGANQCGPDGFLRSFGGEYGHSRRGNCRQSAGIDDLEQRAGGYLRCLSLWREL